MDPARDDALPHEGALPGADGVGECGSLGVGFGVRIAVRLDGDRIADARFEVAAPPEARRPASALCEAMIGGTIDDAAALTVLDVERITGLPRRSPVARTVHFARSAALQPLIRRRPRTVAPVVCVCFHVTERALRETIRAEGLRTVAEVRARLRASGGCATCRPDVEKLLAEESGDR